MRQQTACEIAEKMIGKTFGRLTVLAIVGPGADGRAIARVQCECGVAFEEVARSVRHLRKRSCGCLAFEARSSTGSANRIHGHASRVDGVQELTPTYSTWIGMRKRCEVTTDPAYGNYGGRGIAVCERWLTFTNFLADMGDRPDGMSIDRIDNDGPYEPGNCRWATMAQQANNKRSNRRITFDGVTRTMTEWAHHYGVNLQTFRTRLNRGVPLPDAGRRPATRNVRTASQVSS